VLARDERGRSLTERRYGARSKPPLTAILLQITRTDPALGSPRGALTRAAGGIDARRTAETDRELPPPTTAHSHMREPNAGGHGRPGRHGHRLSPQASPRTMLSPPAARPGLPGEE